MQFTISQIREQMTKALLPIYGVAESGQMIKMLFEHFCGISGTALVLQKNELLLQGQYDLLMGGIKALSYHVPIQYIIGSAWFAGLNFEVDPSVLIPRPETEELVYIVLSEIKYLQSNNNCRLLDIGTGSGCIAVALKKSLPGWNTEACDILEDALQVARRNATKAGSDVFFINADILKWIEWAQTDLYDVIVSNPPYVCMNEKSQMPSNVLEHEPELALFVPDNDPLLFYRAIAEFAHSHLRQNGKLYLEINESYANEVTRLLKAESFDDIQIRKDFRGKDRFAIAMHL